MAANVDLIIFALEAVRLQAVAAVTALNIECSCLKASSPIGKRIRKRTRLLYTMVVRCDDRYSPRTDIKKPTLSATCRHCATAIRSFEVINLLGGLCSFAG